MTITKAFKTRATLASKKADELIESSETLLGMENIGSKNLQNQRQKLIAHMRAMEGLQAELDKQVEENANGDEEVKKMTDEWEDHLTQTENDKKITEVHTMINKLQEKVTELEELEKNKEPPAATTQQPAPAAPTQQPPPSAMESVNSSPKDQRSGDPQKDGGLTNGNDKEGSSSMSPNEKKKGEGSSAHWKDAKARNSLHRNLFDDESVMSWDNFGEDFLNPSQRRPFSSMNFRDIHSMLHRRKDRETPETDLPENKELELIMFKRLSQMETNQAQLAKNMSMLEKNLMDSFREDIRMMAEAIFSKDQADERGCWKAKASERTGNEQCVGFNQQTGRPRLQPIGPVPQQNPSNGSFPQQVPDNGFNGASGSPQTPMGFEAVMAEQLKANLVSSLMVAVKPFEGEEHKYLEFMAQFDAVVHRNKFLSDEMKQSILFTLLAPQISLEHSPTEYSTEGYYRLRESLHRQFGRTNTQMALIMNQLDKMNFPSNNNKALSSALHTFATFAHKMRPFGANPDDPYFVKQFIKKLPEKMALALNKKRSRLGHNITLDALMEEAHNFVEFETIYREPTVQEVYSAEINAFRRQEPPQGYRKTGGYSQDTKEKGKRGFLPPSKERPCRYCGSEDHSANMCTLTLEAKIRAVQRKALCFNCLASGHAAANCRSKFNCMGCGGRHFTGLCTETPSTKSQVNFVAYLDDEDDQELEAQLFHGEGAGTSGF